MSRYLLKVSGDQRGLCFIEYAVMAALCVSVMIPAIAVVADQVLDILNDIAEDLDVIDDFVADLDVVISIESNEDDDPDDGNGLPPI